MGRTTSEVPGWYVEFQANVLRQLPRPGQLQQEVAEGWSGNQQSLKRTLDEALLPSATKPVVDTRFSLINTLDLVVPEGYDHATRLAKFAAEFKKGSRRFYNDAITDENFSKATTKLVAGRKFKVKVFAVTATVSSEDCLALLRSQRAVFVGAQGASLAYELAKGELPIGKWCISFDEKDALYKDVGGSHGVPVVYRFSAGDDCFDLGDFESVWSDGNCLLCFCDEPLGA